MLATRHYMLDAYGCFAEQANSVMVVNDLLVQITNDLDMKPIMPPYLVPYYYCNEADDVGVSAFCFCENGSHITIHTFPYRSCYFVDILTDRFFSEADVTSLIRHQIYAEKISTQVVDRRIFEGTEEDIDVHSDFGPHYMITVEGLETGFEEIYHWLDRIAPRIHMQAISRPYVIFDRVNNARFISGILVVAQSHIAFHYDIEERRANLDIFSCSFLENGAVEELIHDSFGEDVRLTLFARGSKHLIECQRNSRRERNAVFEDWQRNILAESE